MATATARWCAMVAALALLAASPALADHHEKSMGSDPSPEARQKMAAVHQKMADCLKSDRPMNECRSEMRNNCHQMVGERDCPMMGAMGGMGHGMMGGGMMDSPHESPKK